MNDSATLARPRKAGISKPQLASTVDVPRPTASSVLPLAMRDRFETQLHSVAAALTVLEMVFSGDTLDEPKQCEGLMGTMQFVERALGALNVELQDRTGQQLDDFYWGVFCASSLATVFEAIHFEDGYTWNLSTNLICDYLAAINGNVKNAMAALNKMGGAA